MKTGCESVIRAEGRNFIVHFVPLTASSSSSAIWNALQGANAKKASVHETRAEQLEREVSRPLERFMQQHSKRVKQVLLSAK